MYFKYQKGLDSEEIYGVLFRLLLRFSNLQFLEVNQDQMNTNQLSTIGHVTEVADYHESHE